MEIRFRWRISGQKVYVKYWTSWCSICLAGLEELDSLAANETDFRVISIVNPNYKGEMSSEKFKEWYAALPYENITVLLDEDGVWAKEFGVIGYPTSYFISRFGELEETIVGHTSNKEISEIMKKIKIGGFKMKRILGGFLFLMPTTGHFSLCVQTKSVDEVDTKTKPLNSTPSEAKVEQRT